MATDIPNPALKSFVAQIRDQLTLAQVIIHRAGAGYELRHVNDSAASAGELKLTTLTDVRALAQLTESGEFRPLKSAPTLRRGWRINAASDHDLEAVLSRIYPGAIADWFAAQSSEAAVSHYREYTERQTGMYRITTKLDDSQGADVIRVVCDVKSCLKRRLWSVAGIEPDAASAKSLIPCFEPCAILMESARRTVRAAQQESAANKLAAEPKAG